MQKAVEEPAAFWGLSVISNGRQAGSVALAGHPLTTGSLEQTRRNSRRQEEICRFRFRQSDAAEISGRDEFRPSLPRNAPTISQTRAIEDYSACFGGLARAAAARW
jgi:hypothetical protein